MLIPNVTQFPIFFQNDFSSISYKRNKFVKQHNIYSKTSFDRLNIIPVFNITLNKFLGFVYQTRSLLKNIVYSISNNMREPIPNVIRHTEKVLKNKNSSYKPDKEEKNKLHSFIKANRDFPIIDFANWLINHSYFHSKIANFDDLIAHKHIWHKTRTGVRRQDNRFKDEDKFKRAFAMFHRYRESNTIEKYIRVGNGCYIEFVDGDRYEILCVTQDDFDEKALELFNEWKGV
jgi:hypothetical protein